MAGFDAKTLDFLNPIAPNLPLATNEYERQYQDQFANILRLYFNQLDNAFGSILGPAGGKFLKFPYGAFQDTAYTTLNGGINNSVTTITVVSTAGFITAGEIRIEDEVIIYTGITPTTFTGCTRGARGTTNVAHSTGVSVVNVQCPAANTAVPIYMTITDYSNQISLVDTTKITVVNSGIYNLQWSGQFRNSDTAVQDASVWLRINGTDLTGSTGSISIPSTHGGVDGTLVVGWNYFIELQAGQYVEIWWSSTNVKVSLDTFAPRTAPTRPSTAAVIATLSFVSALST